MRPTIRVPMSLGSSGATAVMSCARQAWRTFRCVAVTHDPGPARGFFPFAMVVPASSQHNTHRHQACEQRQCSAQRGYRGRSGGGGRASTRRACNGHNGANTCPQRAGAAHRLPPRTSVCPCVLTFSKNVCPSFPGSSWASGRVRHGVSRTCVQLRALRRQRGKCAHRIWTDGLDRGVVNLLPNCYHIRPDLVTKPRTTSVRARSRWSATPHAHRWLLGATREDCRTAPKPSCRTAG